jgi:hypothetical protein
MIKHYIERVQRALREDPFLIRRSRHVWFYLSCLLYVAVFIITVIFLFDRPITLTLVNLVSLVIVTYFASHLPED